MFNKDDRVIILSSGENARVVSGDHYAGRYTLEIVDNRSNRDGEHIVLDITKFTRDRNPRPL